MAPVDRSLRGSDEALLLAPGPRLVVLTPERLRGRHFWLGGAVQGIGRAPGNDIRLDEDGVAGHHALIYQVDSVVLIEEAGDGPGVYVNGARITTPVVLQPGDTVRLGVVDLRLLGATVPAQRGSERRAGGGAAVSAALGSAVPGSVEAPARAPRADPSETDPSETGLWRANPRRRGWAAARAGMALACLGGVLAGYALVRYLQAFLKLFDSFQLGEAPDFGGAWAGLVPLFITGAAVHCLGLVLIVVGVLMKRGAPLRPNGAIGASR